MRFRLFLLLAALVLAFSAVPARAAGSIRVNVSPNVLLADGISTATVTAEVRSTSARPVRDGTEVRFYTTAGNITQVAFTQGGVARATLTASAVPQTANISVSVGIDQAVATVPMVSKLVEATLGGRVLKVRGKYVAFSEDKLYIQADEQVQVTYRGVDVQANSVQIDLEGETLKALGKVQVAADTKVLVGERLWLNLKTFEGYILAVGVKQWFSAYGLTELPEKPKNTNPDFDLVDLSDSKLVWVGTRADYVVGERVQMQGARAFVGGIKSIRMPFHEADLQAGFGDSTGQYFGVSSQGVSVNFPLYVRMSPGASTAFQVGYGARNGGVGYFTRERGLSVDLVQKYGFSGASEGQASLTNLSSLDRWGVVWNHIQQVNQKTRLVADLQFPAHRDLYGSLNLTSGLPLGTLSVGVSGNKFRKTPFAKTISVAFETKPKPLADGKLNVSAETSFFRRDAGTFRLAPRLNVPVNNDQYQTIGLKIRPVSAQLRKGLSLDSSISLRGIMGNRFNGFGPAVETNLRQTLPGNGYLSAGLGYNRLTTLTSILPATGTLNATMSANYTIAKRLRVAALGSMALDAESKNAIVQASYNFGSKWRVDMLYSLYQYGQFGAFDYQFGLARALFNRELAIYWSFREHKFIFDFGASRF